MKMKKFRPALSQNAAFTLLELLVALVISSLLLLALVQIYSSTQDNWLRVRRISDTDREARALMRQIAGDLRCAYQAPLREATASGATPVETKSLVVTPVPGDSFGSNQLSFLLGRDASMTKRQGQSDIGLAGYYVERLDDQGTRKTQALLRYYRDSGKTFERLNKEQLSTAQDGWIADKNPLEDEPAGLNVVMVRFIPYARVAPGNTLLPQTDGWFKTTLPEEIEIILRVTNSQTATELDSAEDWSGQGASSAKLIGPGTPDDYADDPQVRTYRTRVSIKL